jgi:hypothetical protein
MTYDSAQESGGVKVTVHLTQSEVGGQFAAFVPIFGDFGNGMVRLGQVLIVGSTTRNLIMHLDKQPKKISINAYKEILER